MTAMFVNALFDIFSEMFISKHCTVHNGQKSDPDVIAFYQKHVFANITLILSIMIKLTQIKHQH